MHQFDERPTRVGTRPNGLGGALILLMLGLRRRFFLGDPARTSSNPVFRQPRQVVPSRWPRHGRRRLDLHSRSTSISRAIPTWPLGMALHVRHRVAAELRRALPGDLAAGLLAALAHDPVALPARLSLHPLGGSRRGLGVQLGALLRHHDPRGPLARGRPHLRGVGSACTGSGSASDVLWRRAGCGCRATSAGPDALFVVLAWVLFRAPSFRGGLRVYEACSDWGRSGAGFKWRAIAAAAAAILGPTAWVLAHKVPPSRWIALVVAALFVVALFKIGGDGNYEFIYFQF